MKKINIAELLKDCPRGMELDCAMYENIYFDYISNSKIYPICCYTEDNLKAKHPIIFTWYGRPSQHDSAKCVIFPKGKTTWEGFVPPCEFKDGDIIFTDAGCTFISIFQEKRNGRVATYVDYSVNGNNCYCDIEKNTVPLYMEDDISEIRLATEEEKKKLFDVIKAKGYKWNPETKTLEKLVVKPKFKVGDKIRHKINNDINEISAVYDGFYGLVDYAFMLNMKYQDDYELVQNKFDVTTLKPFDKVLVRDKDTDDWIAHLFSHYHKNYDRPYICIGAEGINEYKQCIPYEENKHLLDNSNDCDEQFKTW